MSREDSQFPVVSEAVEPTMVYIIDRLIAQVEEVPDDDPYKDIEVRRRCQTLWLALDSMSKLGTCCTMVGNPGAVHFNLLINNYQRMIDEYIEDKTGYSPTMARIKKQKEFGWEWT